MKKQTKLRIVVWPFFIITSLFIMLLMQYTDFMPRLKVNYGESEMVNENINTGKTVLDAKTKYQTLNGFGASGAWWAQQVGGWENCEDILTYLYDGEKGIGLNIYRYNLGAGSENDEHIYVKNNRTECFLQENGEYDFTKDANAQNALATARKLAGDDLRVVLFANSAPVSLTENGHAYCSAPETDNAPLVSNLAADKYDDYADYMYKCAEYFVNNGYRVTGVSPVNEPQYAWRAWYNADGTYSMNQEGCHYDVWQVRDLMIKMVERFQYSLLDFKGVKVEMFESGELEGANTRSDYYMEASIGTGSSFRKGNWKLRKYFDTLSYHSYWSSKETKQAAMELMADKYPHYKIACTEYCQMTNDRNTGVFDIIESEGVTNGMGMNFALAMANTVMTDLTVVNAVEWNWWLGCSYGVYPDGLVYINANNHKDVQTSKRLWCLGNFSKFINEGAVRLACSSGVEGIECVAFKNTDKSVAIVYINNADEAKSTSLDNLSGSMTAYLTDEAHDLEESALIEGGTLTLPAKSVVTVVLA